MAMMKLASNPKIEKDGYTLATLLSVSESVYRQEKSTGRNSLTVDTVELDCFELIFTCENTHNKPFTITTRIFGLTVNPEPTGKVRKGSKMFTTYNKLTTTLLRLNILTNELLDKARKDISVLNVDSIMVEFLAIKDIPVRFKLGKEKGIYWQPDLLTLEILQDEGAI